MNNVQRILILLAILLAGVLVAKAQEQTFITLTNYSSIGINDTLEITYRASGNEEITDITPDLEGFTILKGPFNTYSQTLDYTSGAWDSGKTISVYYYVRPKNVGTITIRPATAKSTNGNTYHTLPLTIEVVNGSVTEGKATLTNNPDRSDLFSADGLDRFFKNREYKRYNNPTYRFSFNLPGTWSIKYSKEQNGLICTPVTKNEKSYYSECFEGIVFRMNILNGPLDSVLHSMEVYEKEGDSYYTTDRGTIPVKAKNIRGRTWTDIYHSNICGITCKGSGFHGAGGHCEFLYFSNGKITVELDTNGKELEDDVLTELMASFEFY